MRENHPTRAVVLKLRFGEHEEIVLVHNVFLEKYDKLALRQFPLD